MIRRAAVALSLAALSATAAATAATAQDGGPLSQNPAAAQGPRLRPERVEGIDPAAPPEAGRPVGAILKTLDKVSSAVTEITVPAGDTVEIGSLRVRLGQCRFPPSNPAGEAYAWIEITEPGVDGPVFAGWMIASSPALNALDHPRYDVWVVRCTNV